MNKIVNISFNTAKHNLLTIGRCFIQVIGFADSNSSFYTDVTDGRFTEDLVLHDENAAYDSPNRWWRYRFFRLCTLPFKVKYKYDGDDEVFETKPVVWIRLNRVK